MGNFINIYFSESTEKGSIKFADTNASFAVSRDDRRVGNVTAAGGKQVADEQVARDPVYSQGGGALRRSQNKYMLKTILIDIQSISAAKTSWRLAVLHIKAFLRNPKSKSTTTDK